MTDVGPYRIARLGAEGDGIIETADAAVFVPGALPGETVERHGDQFQRTGAASAERVTPICRHFDVCGGCVAQHMSETLYRGWKHDMVVTAFSYRGLDVTIDPLVPVPIGSRRRAALTARRHQGGIVMGYHQRRSHTLVALEECPVMVPTIVAALPGLKQIAMILPGREGEIRFTVAALEGGLDVAFDEGAAQLSAKHRTRLAELASSLRLARLSVGGDIVIAAGVPKLPGTRGAIPPPPGAFFQAVAAAETAMIERVVAAAGKARRIVDLFAGLGTFTLPLAAVGRVLAVDNDKALLAALGEATRHAQGLKPIETRVRDLFREPLSLKELEGIDTAVFDPPRAGAAAQAEVLARSKTRTIVAVSCNPATLARDLRTLVDGGYTIERVTPIDQFVFSAHVEVVAVLRRG